MACFSAYTFSTEMSLPIPVDIWQSSEKKTNSKKGYAKFDIIVKKRKSWA